MSPRAATAASSCAASGFGWHGAGGCFAPSQRAWVLTGFLVPVNPVVPASEGRDADDR